MAKGYEDLSRRALIRLGKDYDQVSDAALLQYLTENSDKYEGIRPVEKVIDKVDQIKETICGSGSTIKKTFENEADKVLDSVIDTLVSTVDMAESGLESLKLGGK